MRKNYGYRGKHKLDSRLEIRLPEEELGAFREYCESVARPMSDVLRGFIWAVIPPARRRQIAESKVLLPTTAQFLRGNVIVKEEENQ